MKIACASYEFMNNDLDFNLRQIEKALRNAKGKADMVCFGESFLQGFDACCWQYDKDKEIAVSKDSPIFQKLCAMTLTYQVDLCLGYFEKDKDYIYSSYACIEQGKISYNYRRITKNWKEVDQCDEHYQEGNEINFFNYHDQKIMIALCGDLWIEPFRFKTENLLIWPIYVNFDEKQWLENINDYAQQAHFVAPKVLMINSLSKNPEAIGNAFYFENGKIIHQLEFHHENLLIVEI